MEENEENKSGKKVISRMIGENLAKPFINSLETGLFLAYNRSRLAILDHFKIFVKKKL